MKLLFDQNLSPRLVVALSDIYAGSTHVRELALERADDSKVSAHALRAGAAIVSKDADFHQLSFLHGSPPKVVWIRRGNCSTAEIEEILRDHHREIIAFERDPEAAFLALA